MPGSGELIMSDAQQEPTPRLGSSHTFRKAFAVGTIWWIVVSLAAAAHNRSHPPGYLFGELLAPSLIAAAIAGAAGRLSRTRRTWFVIISVFLFTWFGIRLLLLLPHLVE
jgi:hypothetical protein